MAYGLIVIFLFLFEPKWYIQVTVLLSFASDLRYNLFNSLNTRSIETQEFGRLWNGLGPWGQLSPMYVISVSENLRLISVPCV